MRGWCGTLRLRITRAWPWRYFCVKFLVPHSVFYRISNVLQLNEVVGRASVKIFPTCETDERYGGLKLVDRALFETRATVLRNLRSRFGKKDSRALER